MNHTIILTPKSVSKFFFRIILCLFVANLISTALMCMGYRTAFGFAPAFHFDLEYNIPALYSALAIAFAAILLRYIATDEKRENGKQKALHWYALSYIFFYLSFDELMGLHEHLSGLAKILFGSVVHLNESRYWILPYTFLLLLFFLFFIRFYLILPPSTRVSFFIAGFVFIFGAVGVELFSGQLIRAHPRAIFIYTILSTLEELFEMIGIALFIRALITYIATYSPRSNVCLNLVVRKY